MMAWWGKKKLGKNEEGGIAAFVINPLVGADHGQKGREGVIPNRQMTGGERRETSGHVKSMVWGMKSPKSLTLDQSYLGRKESRGGAP